MLNNEKGLGLHGVTYKHFELMIKRYGYMGTINDVILEEIQHDIGLDFKKMINNKFSVQAQYYQNEALFDKGNYEVKPLLAMAFVMCHHHSPTEARDAFWGIINPELEEKVPKQNLIDGLNLLTFWAAEVPYKIETIKEEPNLNYMEFLKEIVDAKDAAVKKAVENFDSEIMLEDIETMDENWLASYKIRALICPNKTVQ